jgi:dTDP-4-amino-4,6-dideoxygalactose transaminase
MMQQINADRIHSWARYDDSLKPLEAMGKLKTPTIPEDCEHNAHMYYILVENERIRDDFIQYMRDRGIDSPFHYVPLHSAPYGLRSARTHGSLFHTDTLSRRLVRLPLYSGVSENIEHILSAVPEYPEFQA